METAELLKRVRRLEIQTNREVDEAIGGAYKSLFQGRGIEFEEVREYTEDDDSRDIDWNVTARIGSPYVKKYMEERELTVMLLVDVSKSSDFGSGDETKRSRAIEVAAMLALSAIRNNDKVGLILFSNEIELYLPPKTGRRHGLRLIRELVAFTPSHAQTDINSVLRSSFNCLKGRSVVFMISDLIDEQDFSSSLRILNSRHDVVVLNITDPVEQGFPDSTGFWVEDIESGELVYFAGGATASQNLREAATELSDMRLNCCKSAGVDVVNISTNQDALFTLVNFFKRRRRRR